MNPKLLKTVRDIDRTKEKIAELQAALPELEHQKTNLENLEIVKAVRSVCVKPGDLEAFLKSREPEISRNPQISSDRVQKKNKETEGTPHEKDN